MCGIVGIAGRPPVGDASRIEAMRDTLIHRGPDDAGAWVSDDGRVALGHRRLSILDLSEAGRQPMIHGPTGARLIFNGEVYNFRDLRDELARSGHLFRTGTDTEVVLAAYAEWGRGAISRLNGMFALAIHDPRDDVLLLARDRAGEKPLYFSHANGRLTFGSELKALLADPRTPREIDAEALRLFMAFGYVPGTHCILRDVRKLPQGHALAYSIGQDRLEQWAYWTLPDPVRRGDTDPDALVEELDGLLQDSVRRQLVADVPVGILLSGGLDSSLVTAMAAGSGRTVKTFNISFPGHGSYDESPHARRIAEHFGTEHHELAAEPTTVDLLPRLAAQYDEPLGDSSMVPTYLVTRLVRRHATVALGGDGGDELFGGYLSYNLLVSEDRWKRFVPGPLRRPLRAVALRMPVGSAGRNTLIRWGSSLEESIARSSVIFDQQARAALLAEPLRSRIPAERYKVAMCNGYRAPLAMASAVDFRSYLVDDVLVKVDRASMLNSLEVRAPLLDHRIVEFAFGRLPDHLRATATRRKVLLRRLARKRLPADFDLDRKQGFTIPLRRWFDGGWADLMQDTLRSADPDVFDRRGIERLLERRHRGRANLEHLFGLAMFVMWQRHYRISAPGARTDG